MSTPDETIQATLGSITPDGVDFDKLPSADGYTFPTEQHAELYRHLRPHRGRANPINSETLSERIGIEDGVAWPTTRAAVRDLLVVGVPVASCGDGYYLAEEGDEIRDCAHSLFGRADATIERAELFVTAAANTEGLPDLTEELLRE